jgi:hypothetical protein
VTPIASRIPQPPRVEPADRCGPLRLAGRLVEACGWGIGGLFAVALVLAGAIAAAAVALAMISSRVLLDLGERTSLRRPSPLGPRTELSTTLKPDLG